MPQVMMSSPYTPTKVVLQKMLREHTYMPQAIVRNCLYPPFASFLTGPSKEPAMNDILGFPKVRSSTFRLRSSCFLEEQRHQCRTGFRLFLHIHSLIAHSTGISINFEKVPGIRSVLEIKGQRKS